MRYKLVFCAFVLLIATPAQTQEFSPIVVETGKPTPSVVRSGEHFKVTYRAKFFDTVVIYEEQMKPDNLALEKIEVIGLEVVKERMSNDTLGFVNVWDFTYTFRIIQPDKGVKKVPSFNFVWVLKKAGVTAEEVKDKEKPREMPTEEVGVDYVSSIVKPPPLDIRDGINFVSPVASGVALRRGAYGVIVTSFLFAIFVLFRFSKYSKVKQLGEAGQEAGAEVAEDGFGVNTESILSPKQARKKFLEDLKKLQGEMQLPKIRLLVRTLVLAELRGTIRDSMSANEIYAKLSGLNARQRKQVGSKYAVMTDLVRRLKDYQEHIDSGKCFLNPVKEVDELKEMVSGLKLHKRASSFVRRLVGER